MSKKFDKHKFCKKVVIGAVTLSLSVFCASTVAFAANGMSVNIAEPKETQSDITPITLEVDDNIYNAFCGMMSFYQDYHKNGGFVMSQPDSSNSEKFVEKDGNLYVIIDGKEYQVVDTEDGLHVVSPEGVESAIEDVADCENPRIRTDEFGNRYYHIEWGDTLCKISSDTHYSVDELAEYNHIRNVHLIYAESDLRIPDDSYTNSGNSETE